MRAIRIGTNVSDDFWENLISVANNAEGLAELLGVREDQVRSWGSRIRDNIDKVRKGSKNHDGLKTKILPTGGI